MRVPRLSFTFRWKPLIRVEVRDPRAAAWRAISAEVGKPLDDVARG
jgi:hypothetical protein